MTTEAIQLVLDAMRVAEDGSYLLEGAQKRELTRNLEARATLPTAAAEIAEMIRFASFLVTEKKSPKAGDHLLQAVTAMVKKVPRERRSDPGMEEARRLLGMGRKLPGTSPAPSKPATALDSELVSRLAAENVRGPRRK